MFSVASVKLEDTLRTRIKRLAETHKRTPHWIMKSAIEEYVEREENRLRDIMEAQESFEEYERTGMHITLAELEEWMKSVRNSDNGENIKCHK